MPVSRLTTEGLASDVAAAYGRAEVRLLQLMAKHLQAGTELPHWAEAKLAELQMFRKRAAGIMEQATSEALDASGHAVRTAYLRGAAAGQGDLDRGGIRVDSPPRHAERAVEALTRAHAGTLEAIGPRVVRQSADAYRDAVVKATAGGLSGATTRLQDAQAAVDDLARRGITGFTDTAGRRWGLESYVDMATRSTTAQAAVMGALDRLEDGGISLVIVSDSSRECPRCAPWEGKVLSRGPVHAMQRNMVTGDMEQVQVDGTLDQAIAAGFMHPNCTHHLSGYIHGATRRGQANTNPEGYAEKVQQRALERKVREWKRREAAALTPEAQRSAGAKVREWQGKVRDHTKATGLPRKPHRESFDVHPPKVRDPLEGLDLSGLDTEVIDQQVADLMEAGDFGPRMERLAGELDRREQMAAVVPHAPGGVAEQRLVHDTLAPPATRKGGVWDDILSPMSPAERAAADAQQAAWEAEAELHGGNGYLSGMTRAQQREEYDTWAYTQWLRAEADTRGVLLNKRGAHERFDPARFFDGSANPATIRRLASPELLEWFGSNPRMSFDEFRAMNGATDKSAKAARDRFKGRTMGEWG